MCKRNEHGAIKFCEDAWRHAPASRRAGSPLHHAYVAPAPPVGACDHVKDNDDQMNGCSTCNPKPVGRETDLRKSVHENWQEYSGRLAAALADALRVTATLNQTCQEYEDRIEDLQRRLDEAVVGYLENVAAFLARKGVR